MGIPLRPSRVARTKKCLCLICLLQRIYVEKESYPKTFRYAHNRKRKWPQHWILVGKLNSSCNIKSRSTCRRTTVVRQQDLPTAAAAASAAAAAEACSSSKLQKQHPAESTNKQRSAVSCALRGTRWNQHPHFFAVLFVRDQAEQQMK